MRDTMIRENGKDVPLSEWAPREAKRLRIKEALAETEAERRAVNHMIRDARHFIAFIRETNTAYENCMNE